MPVNTQIDDFSFTSIKVRPYFNDVCCSEAATAFCQVDDHGEPHLITNWHVVSGRNSDTGRNLDERTGIRPNKLRISPHKSIRTEEVTVELYDADGPRWLTHPINGRLVDVAGVPIGDISRHQWRPINRLQQSPLAIVEGDDVFILGFPDGLTGGISFPIWKRGTVSSLPSLDQENLPYFLIDATTGQGMSGSPVLRRDRVPPDMLNVQVRAWDE